MKIIVNNGYGGFGISNEALAKYNIPDGMYNYELRIHPKLIAAIEQGEDISSPYCALEVVEIPKGATDYMVQEYDGLETVYYVLNGKIYEAVSW